MSKGPLLRSPSDRRTLLFVASWYALASIPWLVRPIPLALAVPLWLALSFASFVCAVITHNVVHCPVFRHRGLERLLRVALTVAYGHPVGMFVPSHNGSHHAHLETRRDLMRTSKARFRWNLLNLLLFWPIVTHGVVRGELRYARFAMIHRPRWFREMLLQAGALGLVSAALLFYDPLSFVLWFALPHLMAAWGIVTINLLQHDGTDPHHPHNHSRSFVGALLNWWTFNNGYHAAHHIRPHLHWSELPEAHARLVRPYADPALEERSMLGYIVRAYLWPGLRLRYDGHPVELPDDGPDESWILARSER